MMIRISDVKPVGHGRVVNDSAKPESLKDSRDVKDDKKTASYIKELLQDAINNQATDVHIEPHGQDIVVRYRIDGVLYPAKIQSTDFKIQDIARQVKNQANVDAAETRLPQDGKFETIFKDKRFIINMASMPVADGEKIVMHIADQTTAPHDLEKLGYWGKNLQFILNSLDKSGLILVIGPTGVGKTSTLYALMRQFHQPANNVVSVEDAIEFKVPGINQTAVNLNAGMTFATALRAALRQDPNAIMISHFEEAEVANLAVKSSLSGKLIMAGAIGINPVDCLDHIKAMRLEPYLIAAATRLIINQRLVKKLCVKCRQEYKPDANEFNAVCHGLGLKYTEVLAHLEQLQKDAQADLAVKPAGKSVANNILLKLWQPKEGGCEACGFTGYKGRTVIAEVFKISQEMQKLIFSNAAGELLYKQAVKEGAVPLPLDGIVKASLGITSLPEVLGAI